MKILIADDTSSDRFVLKSYLKQLGHEVVDAADGQQAVEVFIEHHRSFDLLILDVIMPNVDGYGAARQIRDILGDEWLPIIFLSGLTDDEDLVAGIHAGGDDYLFKPVNKVILSAKMNAMQRISNLRQKLSDSNKRLARIVNVDGLTGASNRYHLDEYLEREFLRARRNQVPISIAMVDVDLFKSFNDSYGHLAGDECLKAIVETISKVCRRATDLVARYGGEEFCCVFSENDLSSAAYLAEKMRQAVADAKLGEQITKTDRVITISIGVASMIPQLNDSVLDLVHRADQALYKAKENGRNQVQTAPEK
nr:diguanylate cyclase [uncultured Desulfobacter sp.]